MNKLTNQQVFDKVVTALRAQDCKSLNDEGYCVYRGKNDTKCAAGHLIPDSLYTISLETFIVPQLDHIFEPMIEDTKFLRELQRIHDIYPVEDWEWAWKNCAKNYNLVYTPPTT